MAPNWENVTAVMDREDNWKLIRKNNEGKPEEDTGKGEPEKRSSRGKSMGLDS